MSYAARSAIIATAELVVTTYSSLGQAEKSEDKHLTRNDVLVVE